ncbi:MAG: peptidoglycan-associated lipoprotein Pal [Gemmatimonadales bacterium]
MFASRRSVAVLAITCVALSACKSKPAPPPAPVAAPPGPAAPPPAPPRVNQDSIDRVNRDRAAAAERTRLALAVASARATMGQQIYFDFDKDDIRGDQRATLDAKVPILNANPNARIRIGGHCDDRGSDEYNLALGQRRSASAKRYLVSRGIAESRIETVSFGKERPAVQGENEDAWAKNRRDEFEIIAGGDNLKAPR